MKEESGEVGENEITYRVSSHELTLNDICYVCVGVKMGM